MDIETALGPAVLGGNTFGWTSTPAESREVLDSFIAAGGRAIDTADVYCQWVPGQEGGESESLIGAWMRSRGCRETTVVMTKVGMRTTREGLSPANIERSANESLERLQTDYIDVYFAHADDPDVPQDEYVDALGRLVTAGKVRTLGASNFTAGRLRTAVEAAAGIGCPGFSISQDEYNLVQRDFEASMRPTLDELGLKEVPHTGLASGFLSGKYRPGVRVDSSRASVVAETLMAPRALDVLNLLIAVSESRGVEPSAVALAWLRQQMSVLSPIASARNADQLRGIVQSFDLVLDEEELGSLSA